MIETYNKIKDQGKPFEVIFVSSDRTEDSFSEYFKDMPWLAVPFGDSAMKTALSSHFGVQGELSLIIVYIILYSAIQNTGKPLFLIPDGIAPNQTIMNCTYVSSGASLKGQESGRFSS